MKPFWKRKKARGPYRTAKDRAKDAKDRVDVLLTEAWLEDLKTHPNYLREIARSKFGYSDVSGGEEGYTQPESPSLLEQISELRQVRDALQDEFGSSENKRGGLMGLIQEVISQDREGKLAGAVANLISGVAGQISMPPQQQPERLQVTRRPESQRLEQAEEPTDQQGQITALLDHLLSLTPEAAAKYLYSFKDTDGDVRQIAFNTLAEEASSVDELLSMVEAGLNMVPSYQFLSKYLAKLKTPSRRQWLSLLLDEVKRLNSPNTPPETSETGVNISDVEGENE